MKRLIFGLCLLLVGCAYMGVANKTTMMERWENKQPSVALLDDINGWANWYHHKPLEKGQCADQADEKLAILKALNIPAKRMHCVITRDPYHPVGHAFVVAQLDGKDYIMDNGTVQDVVWEYSQALKSTWGIEEVEEW